MGTESDSTEQLELALENALMEIHQLERTVMGYKESSQVLLFDRMCVRSSLKTLPFLPWLQPISSAHSSHSVRQIGVQHNNKLSRARDLPLSTHRPLPPVFNDDG
jgi:hypothetical protein